MALGARFAEAISALARSPGEGPLRKTVRVAANLARRELLRVADPSVRYRVGSLELELPFSHQLPFHQRVHPAYDAAVGLLAGEVARKYPQGTAIDIGANVGDTAALMRSACALPILCIEGNETFLPFLRRNAAVMRGVEIEPSYLSDHTGSAAARVSSGGGTARLTEASAGGTVALSTLPDLLRRWPAFAHPALIKSDTDGFDCRILTASKALLEAVKPVVYFEYDPSLGAPGSGGLQFFELLAACGYTRLLAWDNRGEYLVGLSLADRSALEDLHAFAGRRGGRFVDLAVFSALDEDLAESARRHEHATAP